MKFWFDHHQFMVKGMDGKLRPRPVASDGHTWTPANRVEVPGKSTAMIRGITTVLVTDNADRELFQGVAECSAKDTFNKRIGRRLALLDATKDCSHGERAAIFAVYREKTRSKPPKAEARK